jgi:hypothetical protein
LAHCCSGKKQESNSRKKRLHELASPRNQTSSAVPKI